MQNRFFSRILEVTHNHEMAISSPIYRVFYKVSPRIDTYTLNLRMFTYICCTYTPVLSSRHLKLSELKLEIGIEAVAPPREVVCMNQCTQLLYWVHSTHQYVETIPRPFMYVEIVLERPKMTVFGTVSTYILSVYVYYGTQWLDQYQFHL